MFCPKYKLISLPNEGDQLTSVIIIIIDVVIVVYFLKCTLRGCGDVVGRSIHIIQYDIIVLIHSIILLIHLSLQHYIIWFSPLLFHPLQFSSSRF